MHNHNMMCDDAGLIGLATEAIIEPTEIKMTSVYI